MLKLRQYKSCDAQAIAKWVQDKDVFIHISIRLTKNKKHPYGCLLFLERMMCCVHMLFVHLA